MTRLKQTLVKTIISVSVLLIMVNLYGNFHAGSLFSSILAALILICSLRILREEKKVRMRILSELAKYKTIIDTLLTDVDKEKIKNESFTNQSSSTYEEPACIMPDAKEISAALEGTVGFSNRQSLSGRHSIMYGISQTTADNTTGYASFKG